MPPRIWARGIYWRLLLTLPSLLLAGVMSVNSAFAADEIMADNQVLDKTTLNTDETAKVIFLPTSQQVIPVPELNQKVISEQQIESITHQQQPQITAHRQNLWKQMIHQLILIKSVEIY